MKRAGAILVAAVLAACGPGAVAYGQQAQRDSAGAATGPVLRIATAASPDTVTIGHPFTSIVRVMAPAGAVVVFHGVEAGDSLQALDTVRALAAAADSGATAAYRLVAWVAAPVTAAAAVRITYPDGSEHVYSVPLAVPGIRSVLPAGEGVPPRPGRGVAPLPRGRSLWPPWVGAAVVAALLALWLAMRRRPPGAAPDLDPRVVALEALARARAGAGEDPRILHERVARILRRYLAASDAAWGEEWTSTELLARVAAEEALPSAATGELVGVLAIADRVKFAGARPTREATGDFLARVTRWIEAYPPPDPADARPREAA